MELGVQRDKEGQTCYGYMTFETGKKILLSNEEHQELMDWVYDRVQSYIRTGNIHQG